MLCECKPLGADANTSKQLISEGTGKMNYSRKFLPLLLLSILASCSTQPNFENLLSSTCSAPCWSGVTPGKTSKDELAKIIPAFPYYQENHTIWTDDQYNSSNNVPSTPNSTLTMVVGKNWASVEISIVDNIVSDILISSAVTAQA
jgi:hypothetical protein